MAASRERKIERVLVASDMPDALVRGMERAAGVQRMTGAAVVAVLVTYDPVTEILVERYSPDVSQRVIDDLLRNERQGLDAALAPVRATMTQLDVEVVFARHTASAICAAARDHDASLIVKPLARSANRADFLHAPIDWTLMREAPCPVLFTRAAPWPSPPRVLATVDVIDTAHAHLNEDILRLGAQVAATVGAELHVATAVPVLARYLTVYQVAQDYTSAKEQLRETRREALTALLRGVGVDAAATYVVEGRPADVIRALAAELGAGLTVVGTAGRTGLKKLLIGNTAEAIVSDLPTDLLTIRASKPARASKRSKK
ncbi:MAG TPA: universal stress protein [Pseudomonadales bacterium]|nr:universal stress protein [Pseudomonadales bacterium]